jgi:hypothetical protein
MRRQSVANTPFVIARCVSIFRLHLWSDTRSQLRQHNMHFASNRYAVDYHPEWAKACRRHIARIQCVLSICCFRSRG